MYSQISKAVFGAAVAVALSGVVPAQAQYRSPRIDSGTVVTVRMTDTIDTRTPDGGGAVLGGIIGAIAGGGKGGALGAAAGAAAGAGAELVTAGSEVRVPRNSVVTFRLTRPLANGIADDGFTRDGVHYHRY